MDTVNYIISSIENISTFIAIYTAYYLYSTCYKKVKQAQRYLHYKKELLELNKYFQGNEKCTSIKKLQGKNKNFNKITERSKHFECILWETRVTLVIYKNETFNEVNKYILSLIKDIDEQLNILFGVEIGKLPFSDIIDDMRNRQ